MVQMMEVFRCSVDRDRVCILRSRDARCARLVEEVSLIEGEGEGRCFSFSWLANSIVCWRES
jgi:hypothetical protein